MVFNVVAIGEVLWDLLLTGRKLGGAPANFGYHAHALGARTHIITRVGNDDDGCEIIHRFREMALPEETVQIDDVFPTAVAKVILSGNGLAQFKFQENVAWDHIAVTEVGLAAAREVDALCFGSLAQRSSCSRASTEELVAVTPKQALRVFDINLRPPFYSRSIIEESLKQANVLKLNNDELPVLAEMFSLKGSVEGRIERLAQDFNLQVVALTRGPNGSLLYRKEEQEEHWSDCVSRPVEVVDTVGAGDSFTAALVLGLLHKMDLDEINDLANDVARFVCSQPGATPILPKEFARRFAVMPQR
jgi:fructokinase